MEITEGSFNPSRNIQSQKNRVSMQRLKKRRIVIRVQYGQVTDVIFRIHDFLRPYCPACKMSKAFSDF